MIIGPDILLPAAWLLIENSQWEVLIYREEAERYMTYMNLEWYSAA